MEPPKPNDSTDLLGEWAKLVSADKRSAILINILKFLSPLLISGGSVLYASGSGWRIAGIILAIVGCGAGAYALLKRAPPDLSKLKGPSPFGPGEGSLLYGLGRSIALTKIKEFVATGNVFVIFLVGPRGIGNTSLVNAGLRDLILGKTPDPDPRFIYINGDSRNLGDVLLRRVNFHITEDSKKFSTVEDLVKSESAEQQVIVIDNAELAEAPDELIEWVRLASGKEGSCGRKLIVVLDERAYREKWSGVNWINPHSLEPLFLKRFEQSTAMQVAKALADNANLRISKKLLREIVADAALEAEGRVSPLALSVLIQFVGLRRVRLRGYRELGYSAGILRTIIEDHLRQSAHGNSQVIQEALARQLAAGDAGFGVNDLGLENLAPDQITNVLSGLSSSAVHVLRSGQEQGKYTIFEEWVPSLKASVGTADERRVVCLSDHLAKKNTSWSYWAGRKRGFYRLIGQGKYLLASPELSKIDKLIGRNSPKNPELSAYIAASRHHRMWRRGGIAALILCALLLPFAYKYKPSLQIKNLPDDFDRYSDQLSDLSCVCMAENLKWLPRNLAFLEISCDSLKGLEGIPPNLTHLGLSGTRIESLDEIPVSVKELDISSSLVDKIDGLKRLRPTTLNINQLFVSDMKSIPDSVRSLKLAEGRIDKLEGLPKGLTDLEVRGTLIQSLKGLPNRITSLVLIQNTNLAIDFLPTHLTSLKTSTLPRDRALIPPSLETLILEGAGDVEGVPDVKKLTLGNSKVVGDFPKCLESLKFNDESSAVLKPDYESQGVPFLKLPASKIPGRLQYLKIQMENGSELSALPKNLWGLDLADSVNLRSLAGLNLNLTELDITNTGIMDLRDVPASVLTLRFESCLARGLSEFPASLESLDVGDCSELRSLAHLPESLLRLDIHGTLISTLPPDLPKSLKLLDISNTKILGHLPNLPDDLEELILHRGQVHTLEGLPKSVKKLRFKEPIPKG